MENTDTTTEIKPDLEARVEKLEKSVKWLKILHQVSFAIVILGVAGYSVSAILNNVRKAV
jgi:hypothetical protein